MGARLASPHGGASLNLTRATLDAALKYPWLNAVAGCDPADAAPVPTATRRRRAGWPRG